VIGSPQTPSCLSRGCDSKSLAEPEKIRETLSGISHHPATQPLPHRHCQRLLPAVHGPDGRGHLRIRH